MCSGDGKASQRMGVRDIVVYTVQSFTEGGCEGHCHLHCSVIHIDIMIVMIQHTGCNGTKPDHCC